MKRYLLIAGLLLCALSAYGQRARRNNTFYVYDNCASLSAAACDVTIQQPASGSNWVMFETAQVYCSVACVVTISRDGTAATGTAATEVSLNGGATAAATGFIDSDAGAGTTIISVELSAGETVALDLAGLFLEDDDSTANNLTFQTDAISGDASIYVRWREE